MQNVKCKIKNGRRAPLFFPNIGDCIIAKHCSLSNSLNQEETFCVTLIRRRRRSWRHLPLRGRQARGNGSFLFKKSVFSFWYQQKEGVPHTLAFPWGKVPTSPCGGRRMRVTVPISARFRQPDKPQFFAIMQAAITSTQFLLYHTNSRL